MPRFPTATYTPTDFSVGASRFGHALVEIIITSMT
jgi:hypothetical protein